MRKRLIALLILVAPLLMATSAGLHWKSFTFSSDGTNTTVTTTMLFPNGTALLPSVAGTNFTTTGLFWAAGPILGFTTAGVEAARFNASQRLLFNSATSYGTRNEQIEVNNNLSDTTTGIGVSTWAAGAGQEAALSLYRSANSTVGSHTALANGGNIGSVYFNGDTGSAFAVSASILAFADAAQGVGSSPGRIVFSTTPVGSTSATEAMRIDSSQRVTLVSLTSNTAIVAGTGGLVQSVAAVANGVLISGSPPTFSATPQVSAIGVGAAAGAAGTGTFSGSVAVAGASLGTNAVSVPGTNGAFNFGARILLSATAPTISSGFGTSPSIDSNNGGTTFRVNVGGGGVATSGVVGMPTATTGWNCFVEDQTTANVNTRQTASANNSVTFGTTVAWAANDILIAVCMAY